MKIKLVFAVLSMLFFASCAPKIHLYSYIFDLSEYDKNGMFITVSNSVNFEYIPIGLVQTISGGAERVVEGRKTTYKTLSQQEVFDKFVEVCRSKGADAVINCEIKQLASQRENLSYQITGMAIKRK